MLHMTRVRFRLMFFLIAFVAVILPVYAMQPTSVATKKAAAPAGIKTITNNDGKGSNVLRTASDGDANMDAEFIKKAAEAGDLDAMAAVGFWAFRYQSYDAGILWFKKILAASTDEQHPAVIRANYGLGSSYGSGKGVDQDSKKAVYHLGKAADYHALACDKLGGYYERGDGTEKDLKAAYACYVVAMDIAAKEKKVCTPAIINCARCLFGGIGCAVDVVKAQNLLIEAQEKGSVQAMVCQAYCVANGIGVDFATKEEVAVAVEVSKGLLAAAEVLYQTLAEGKREVSQSLQYFEDVRFGLTQMKCGICHKGFVHKDGTVAAWRCGDSFNHFHLRCI